MKLRTKLEKGKYNCKLLKVPTRLKFESLVRLDENKTKTVEEIHEMVKRSNKEHETTVKYNEEQRTKLIREFKEDMVKEVKRTLGLDERKSKKVANKVYNNYQWMGIEKIVDKLEEHIEFLKGIL